MSIQCNRLTIIDLISTLEFLMNLILQIFIQFNPLFFIQSYWDKVVDLFYWGEFSVNHVLLMKHRKQITWWREKSVVEHEQSSMASCIDSNGNKYTFFFCKQSIFDPLTHKIAPKNCLAIV